MIVFVIYKKTINKGVVNKISYKNHIAKLDLYLLWNILNQYNLVTYNAHMKNSRLLKYQSFYHQTVQYSYAFIIIEYLIS